LGEQSAPPSLEAKTLWSDNDFRRKKFLPQRRRESVVLGYTAFDEHPLELVLAFFQQ